MTILDYVKENCGVPDGTTVFDSEILMFINSSVSGLFQIGVDEFDGITIEATTDWPEFSNINLENVVKAHVAIKTKVMFDPNNNSVVRDAIERQLAEWESRIQLLAEQGVETE